MMTFVTDAISNKGLDSEKEYTYDGANDPCWTAAEKRVVASVDSAVHVPPNDEAALAAAVAIAPVAVSIEASPQFKLYKTGTFKGAMTCGNTSASLDHAVLAVGYTADAWIVKNSSWGASVRAERLHYDGQGDYWRNGRAPTRHLWDCSGRDVRREGEGEPRADPRAHTRREACAAMQLLTLLPGDVRPNRAAVLRRWSRVCLRVRLPGMRPQE